ncbi:MAG: ribosome biogenesis GTPase YlqF [Gammaproteobacteria bacterium]
MTIGWYPGHMHKARKDITLALQQVDAVLEIVDARLPYASENPLLNQLIGSKPRLRVLNKADLADPAVSKRWLAWYEAQGIPCMLFEKEDATDLKILLRRSTAKLERKASRANRLMIVGIPNVGKSTLINLLAGRKIAKVGDEPAVTKARQEIQLGENLVLLDTPGILWPKLEDQQGAYRLAASGAIRNTAIELGDVGLFAVQFLQERYPRALQDRYGIDPANLQPLACLEAIGKKRGCLTKAGIDYTKAGEVVINDLRTGKLGRISLETPDDIPAVSPSVPNSPAQALLVSHAS